MKTVYTYAVQYHAPTRTRRGRHTVTNVSIGKRRTISHADGAEDAAESAVKNAATLDYMRDVHNEEKYNIVWRGQFKGAAIIQIEERA